MYNFLKFNPSVFCAHGASKRKGEPLLYSTVLFDLDGTLIESGPGIFAVTREVLKDMGLKCPDDERIKKMVGPPLRHSFRDVIGVPEERVEEAAQKYMTKAKTVGLELIKPYAGVVDMLKALKAQGVRRGIVTSKLTPTAKMHLERYGLIDYIDYVRGGIEGWNGANKETLLRQAIEDLGADKKDIVMVGDRLFDLEAANAVGVDAIGVLYGYGSEAELKAYSPKYIVKSVNELSTLLCGGKAENK